MSYKQKLSSVHDIRNKVTHAVGSQGSVPSEVTFNHHVWSGFGQGLSPYKTKKFSVCKIVGNDTVVAATPTVGNKDTVSCLSVLVELMSGLWCKAAHIKYKHQCTEV